VVAEGELADHNSPPDAIELGLKANIGMDLDELQEEVLHILAGAFSKALAWRSLPPLSSFTELGLQLRIIGNKTIRKRSCA
jgi:hypothetical protein